MSHSSPRYWVLRRLCAITTRWRLWCHIHQSRRISSPWFSQIPKPGTLWRGRDARGERSFPRQWWAALRFSRTSPPHEVVRSGAHGKSVPTWSAKTECSIYENAFSLRSVQFMFIEYILSNVIQSKSVQFMFIEYILSNYVIQSKSVQFMFIEYILSNVIQSKSVQFMFIEYNLSNVIQS